jgi:hypothetical protein
MSFDSLSAKIILNHLSVRKQLFFPGWLDRPNLYVLPISADKTADGKYGEVKIVLAEVNPVRNSSGVLNPAGIILKSNPAAEQRGIISNGVNREIVVRAREEILALRDRVFRT